MAFMDAHSCPMQAFTETGKRLSPPSNVPAFCEAVADTPEGQTVCNRGCGFTLAHKDKKGPFQVFRCPFGVTNVLMTLPAPGPSTQRQFLIGGRVFENYGQFRDFVQAGSDAGADLDRLLTSAMDVTFENPQALQPLFLETLRQAQTEDPKMPEFENSPVAFLAGVPLKRLEHIKKPEPTRPEQLRLASQAQLLQRLSEEIYRSERQRRPIALLLVRVNMAQWLPGHSKDQIRDLILHGVANIVRPGVRTYDQLACLDRTEAESLLDPVTSHETLAIVLPETTREAAGSARDRLLGEVQDRFLAQVPRQENPENALGLETGLALYPEDGIKPMEILQAACVDLLRQEEKGKSLDTESPDFVESHMHTAMQMDEWMELEPHPVGGGDDSGNPGENLPDMDLFGASIAEMMDLEDLEQSKDG